jgi:hypothetical protein
MQLESHMRLIADLAAGRTGAESLQPLLVPGSEPGPRPLVYRNSGQAAKTDALRSNYRALARWMGDARFSALARAFAEACPARSGTLVGWGDGLADWMQADAERIGEPWLADLARLDRAWLEAHLAADAPLISAEALSGLGADLPSARVSLHPAVRLMQTRFDIAETWMHLCASEDAGPPDTIAMQSAFILIWRAGYVVDSRVLEAAEASFLTACQKQSTLGEAGAAALATDPGADLSQVFARIVSSGLLTELHR